MDYPLPGSQFTHMNDSNWYQLAAQNRGHLAAGSVFSDGYIQQTILSSHDEGGYHPGPAAQPYDNKPGSHGSGLSGGQMALSFSQYPKTIATQTHQVLTNNSASDDDLQPMAPLPKSRKRKAPTLSLNDWELVKDRVIELYFTLDLKLLEVKRRIEEEFRSSGFTAT
jgi:hypothetical protein